MAELKDKLVTLEDMKVVSDKAIQNMENISQLSESIVKNYSELKSDLDSNIKNLIKHSLNKPISFNKVGMKLANCVFKNGKFIPSDNSDLVIAKIGSNVVASSFLGGKSFNEWKSIDTDIIFFCETVFLNKDLNFISQVNSSEFIGVSGFHVALLGRGYTTPEGCEYVVQRFKKGYLDYAVITDIHYDIVASSNMDLVWKQSDGSVNYTLKPYFAPYSSYSDDGVIIHDDYRNSTYPLRVLPRKTYKITGGTNRSNICIEYDADMNMIRRMEIHAIDGYFEIETGDTTNYLAISYDNSTNIYLKLFRIEEATVKKSDLPNIAYTSEDVISMLEVGGTIELIPKKIYTFTDTLTYHQDTTTIIGNGAIFDFSNMDYSDNEIKPAIHIISKNATDGENGLILGTLRKQATHYIEGCYIVGANLTPNYEDGRFGAGILFEGDNTTKQNSAFVTLRNCTIAGFRVGCLHKSQSWCITYDMCNINVCDEGITVSYGALNYGEKIGVINSVINTCTFGITCLHSNGTVQCVNTSLDYNFSAVKVEAGGKVIINSCHLEDTKNKNWMITAIGPSCVFVTNSVVYFKSTDYGFAKTLDSSAKIISKDNCKEYLDALEKFEYAGSTVIVDWIN